MPNIVEITTLAKRLQKMLKYSVELDNTAFRRDVETLVELILNDEEEV